jgi:hypothetical protein
LIWRRQWVIFTIFTFIRTNAGVENWIERYTESWLRDDKYGELDAVIAVMRGKKFDYKYLLTNA